MTDTEIIGGLAPTRADDQLAKAMGLPPPHAHPNPVPKGYDSLFLVLREAFDQASIGKGSERHANSLAFEDQPMQKLIDLYGVGFAHGQAAKKLQEAQGMLRRGEIDKAIHEMLGAIVYTAGAVIHTRKGGTHV